MNNFNLYLDNLVDQGYDITLMKYYFELFYLYGYENKIINEYEYGCSYPYKNSNEYGDGDLYPSGYGFIYNFGFGDGLGYEKGSSGIEHGVFQ